MANPDQPRPAGHPASLRLVSAPENRPAPRRPVNGHGGFAPDAIADFLDHLTKQYESAAVLYPDSLSASENQPSRRP
jgi:hypothetical protein